ncbi:non-ribosomal peptide synthetase [Rhodococcus sp. IEGM 1330]|uniref:non-ribosomal peptide synthetase n=1 Tax=Rhodococcus sp. IEGM 1330 TaxID=3082225 RepID=UPI002955332A|nr:non-ribosomal peptide synthetase [Rhodococcus sp. IEGM 1330]MDV8022896.1 amino acid adenylation domain-containing protein [Rhodococcus sp. IEGM 1330]
MTNTTAETAGTPQSKIAAVLPLTALQVGMYLQSSLAAANQDPYLSQTVLDLSAPIRIDRLTRALEHLLERHPNIKALLRQRRNGDLVWVVPRASTPELTAVEGDWNDHLGRDRAAAFAFFDGPLIRFSYSVGPRPPRVLITYHHALMDGWSEAIFVRELIALYEGGESAALPPAPDYRKYLAWTAGQDRDAARAHWADHLDRFERPTLIAGDAPQSNSCSRIDLDIDEALARRVAKYARSRGATTNVVVQVAWASMLATRTGAGDVSFGMAASLRPFDLEGAEAMVGLLLNTVPVRIRFGTSESVADVVDRLQADHLDLEEHRFLGLSEIAGTVGGSELFDTIVVYQNYPAAVPNANEGDAVSERPVVDEVTVLGAHMSFPMALIVGPDPALWAFVLHDDAAVDHGSATLCAETFVEMLDRMTSRPDVDVPQLLSAPDGQGYSVGASRRVSTLEAALADRFAQSSEDIALTVGGEAITYAELRSRVAEVSTRLRSWGIGTESRVAIALGRGIDMVAALLATIDVGAVFVPIDIRYPRERFDYVLADSRHDILLVDDATPTTLTAFETATRIHSSSTTEVVEEPFARSIPGDCGAYLVYTSGSTGMPKGVLGTRSALANRLYWAMLHWGGPTSRIAKSSLSFIDGATELLTGILAGQRLVLAQDHEYADARALVELVARSRAEQVTTVGSLAAALATTSPQECCSLTSWILSGEPLTGSTIEAIRRATPNASVHNSYGSSEVAGDVAVHRVAGDSAVIGTAVDNTVLGVLDDRMRPLRTGIGGELYVSGVQLARGYFGRPAETAARFVADPGGDGGRMYRTGDRARILDDGALEFLGRADRQVKVRGHRVELGEVENRTVDIESVDACAVVAVTDDGGATVLVAYVTPGNVDAAAVRDVLRGRVPDYLVPAFWVAIDRLPSTPNGKTDLVTLTQRGIPENGPSRSRAAVTDDERCLVDLFADATRAGAESIGVDDDFFALGGDSITAITMVHHARGAGLAITTADVFECRTVAGLVERARNAETESAAAEPENTAPLLDAQDLTELRALGIDPELARPATPLQQGLAFQSVAAGDGLEEIYVIATEFEVWGELHIGNLEDALDALSERHPALRSRFLTLNTGVTVAVRDTERVHVRRHTVDDPDSPSARALVDADRGTFDIEHGPLVRVLLLDCGEQLHRVVLTVHHLLVDGWSMATVGTELFMLYRGRDLPAPASFDDYLRWLSRRDGSSIDVWRRALGADVVPTILAPTALVSEERSEAREIEMRWDVQDTARLTASARRRSVTASELVNAAWAVVLSAFTDSGSVVFGSTVSGRPTDLDRVGDMVGLFINTIPVRVDIGPDATVSSVLSGLRDFSVAVAAHHHVGLADVQKALGGGTLFDTLVVFENFAAADTSCVDTEDFSVSVAGFHTVTHYPLTLTVFPGEELRLVVEYRSDAVSVERARAVASAMTAVLRTFAEAGDPFVASVPLVDEATALRLTAEQAGIARPYPSETLVELFSEQVALQPDTIAVQDAATALTFAELDCLSNRTARWLIGAGVGAEDLVAVVAPRTVITMAAILGVMKSGAAYLPIDPNWPADRTRQILDDAKPVVTVTADSVVSLAASSTDSVGITDVERRAPLHPDHPVYSIYTSGTTGVPKGVLVPHRGLTNLYHSHRENVHEPAARRAGKSTLNVAHAWSMAFDASWQPQLWLFGGHTVHLIDPETVLDPVELTARLTALSADFIEVVPSLLEQMMRSGSIDTLSTVGVGGEAVSAELWNRLRSRQTLVAYNFYGPTEATVDAVYTSTELSSDPVIGRPVTNMQAYVLDRSLRLVPPGVFGELYLAGPGVVRGYRNAPGRTAHRFVADPFTPDGTRLYRTGDLVAWTENGTLRYGGRSDDQVKIRGHRVEVGEVEVRLREFDAVVDARVVVRGSENGNAVLAGYVVAEQGCSLDPNVVRARLRSLLPSYMVPASLTVLDAFPVLPNGKLDASALPEPELATRSGRPPNTDAERQICRAAAAVLHVTEIGADDDFFDLGGDSIMAMELAARLRSVGLTVSPRHIVSLRTPESIAEGVVSAGSQPEVVTIDPYGTVPLTPVVRWMDALDGPIDEISQAVLLEAPASLTEGSLTELVSLLTDRHPILHSCFERNPGSESIFTVLPGGADVRPWIRIVDVDGPTESELADRVGVESRAARARLNPADARMVDIVWLRHRTDPESSGELLITLHHLVVDGVSWRILLPDLGALWKQTATERSPIGPSMRQWAHEVLALASAPRVLADLDYWASVGDGATSIPLTRPLDPAVDTGARVRTVDFALREDESAHLLSAATVRLGVSVEHLLLATFAAATAEWIDSEITTTHSFLVDVEGHGRTGVASDRVDGSSVVGWLTAVFPLRIAAQGGDHRTLIAHESNPAAAETVLHELAESARESRESVPGDGSTYGMLRWMGGDAEEVLRRTPDAAIEFNYLGRFDAAADGPFGASRLRSSLDSAPGVNTPCSYALIVDSYVHDHHGSSVMGVTMAWAEGVVDGVEELAKLWHEALSATCRILDTATG